MSKIGNKPIVMPTGVTLNVTPAALQVQGPKGQLETPAVRGIELVVADNLLTVSAKKTDRTTKMNHGLVRSLVANMVEGVSTGFTRKLELVGTGYRVAKAGQGLTLTVGFSHPVKVDAVPGIQLDIEGNNIIIVSGIDKHLVGQVAANIRRVRPPEPYKGKGIRYQDEVVRRKQGKTMAK